MGQMVYLSDQQCIEERVAPADQLSPQQVEYPSGTVSAQLQTTCDAVSTLVRSFQI